MLANLDTNFNPTSDQLIDLSAGLSSFLQKIYANSSHIHSNFVKVGIKELEDLMEAVMNDTADSNELDKLIFNTNDWILQNTSWDGNSLDDIEEDLKLLHIPFQTRAALIILLIKLIHHQQIL